MLISSNVSQPSSPVASSQLHRGLDVVLASELSTADGLAYDQFVATAASGHYSQTRAWARVAVAGKPFAPYYFLARRDGRVVGAALLLRTRIKGVLLPIAQVERGPVTGSLECLPEVLAALRRACLRRGIVRLSVMPYWWGDEKTKVESLLAKAGFSDVQRFAGRHVHSLRIDLATIDEKKPFAASYLSKPRQNTGRAERAGATARAGRREDFAAFRAMQASLLAQEGKQPPAEVWYTALADFFLGAGQAVFVEEFGGEVVSAILITMHNGVATYALGATSGRPLKFSKTVLPMREAILWAKAAGAHTFDMGGIPMAGDTDAKRGMIAEFKHSYSRSEVFLVHEYARWF